MKVSFFVGKKQITKRKDYDGSKLSEDSSLYFDLNNVKDRTVLKIMLGADTIILDGVIYRILEREFVVDGTALFLTLKETI